MLLYRTKGPLDTNGTETKINHHFGFEPGSSLMILQTFQMILNLMNVICHGVGVNFLRSLYEKTEHKVQYVYLISLSGCELTINFLTSIECFLELIGHTSWHEDTDMAHSVQKAITIIYLICATGFSLVFFVTMICISVDRLLDIYLNIHYEVYWNQHKAKILMKTTWCIGVLMSLVSAFLNDWEWEDNVLFEFFYPILEIGFIVLALFTYSFIFRKFKAGRKPPHQLFVKESTVRKNSTFEAFRNSRFYISVLLIFTFMLFMIIPDLLFLFFCVIPDDISELRKEKIRTACWISYGIANLSDAFIYIFLQVEVKRHATRKFKDFVQRHKCFSKFSNAHMMRKRREKKTVKLSLAIEANMQRTDTCISEL